MTKVCKESKYLTRISGNTVHVGKSDENYHCPAGLCAEYGSQARPCTDIASALQIIGSTRFKHMSMSLSLAPQKIPWSNDNTATGFAKSNFIMPSVPLPSNLTSAFAQYGAATIGSSTDRVTIVIDNHPNISVNNINLHADVLAQATDTVSRIVFDKGQLWGKITGEVSGTGEIIAALTDIDQVAEDGDSYRGSGQGRMKLTRNSGRRSTQTKDEIQFSDSAQFALDEKNLGVFSPGCVGTITDEASFKRKAQSSNYTYIPPLPGDDEVVEDEEPFGYYRLTLRDHAIVHSMLDSCEEKTAPLNTTSAKPEDLTLYEVITDGESEFSHKSVGSTTDLADVNALYRKVQATGASEVIWEMNDHQLTRRDQTQYSENNEDGFPCIIIDRLEDRAKMIDERIHCTFDTPRGMCFMTGDGSSTIRQSEIDCNKIYSGDKIELRANSNLYKSVTGGTIDGTVGGTQNKVLITDNAALNLEKNNVREELSNCPMDQGCDPVAIDSTEIGGNGRYEEKITGCRTIYHNKPPATFDPVEVREAGWEAGWGKTTNVTRQGSIISNIYNSTFTYNDPNGSGTAITQDISEEGRIQKVMKNTETSIPQKQTLEMTKVGGSGEYGAEMDSNNYTTIGVGSTFFKVIGQDQSKVNWVERNTNYKVPPIDESILVPGNEALHIYSFDHFAEGTFLKQGIYQPNPVGNGLAITSTSANGFDLLLSDSLLAGNTTLKGLIHYKIRNSDIIGQLEASGVLGSGEGQELRPEVSFFGSEINGDIEAINTGLTVSTSRIRRDIRLTKGLYTAYSQIMNGKLMLSDSDSNINSSSFYKPVKMSSVTIPTDHLVLNTSITGGENPNDAAIVLEGGSDTTLNLGTLALADVGSAVQGIGTGNHKVVASDTVTAREADRIVSGVTLTRIGNTLTAQQNP